jgi:hypothetical protein
MKQKQMFSDGEELATSLARIFDRNLKMTDWPDVDCELKQCHVADNYKEKMEVLQNVIRSSASTVCSEHALDPLRACIARVVPEVEQLKSEREVKLTDYDSYRRRLKEKETKKEQLDVSCPLHVPSTLFVLRHRAAAFWVYNAIGGAPRRCHFVHSLRPLNRLCRITAVCVLTSLTLKTHAVKTHVGGRQGRDPRGHRAQHGDRKVPEEGAVRPGGKNTAVDTVLLRTLSALKQLCCAAKLQLVSPICDVVFLSALLGALYIVLCDRSTVYNAV